MKFAALLTVTSDLTKTEEARLADQLSTVACEILKGEYKKGKAIFMEVPEDDA
jgi:hypothetical protein